MGTAESALAFSSFTSRLDPSPVDFTLEVDNHDGLHLLNFGLQHLGRQAGLPVSQRRVTEPASNSESGVSDEFVTLPSSRRQNVGDEEGVYGSQSPHLQCVSSGRPACCSCQRARHLGCTRRGHKQGLIIVSFPVSPVESSRQIQHTSCSSCESVGEWVSDCSTQVRVDVQMKWRNIRHVGAMQFPPNSLLTTSIVWGSIT